MKQAQGIPLTEALKHNAKVLIVNSLVMRRLGRFRDRQVATEGEQWVKEEWEKMERPGAGLNQHQLVNGTVGDLKRDHDAVSGDEDEVSGKRVKTSHTAPRFGALANMNGEQKLIIEISSDEEEEESNEDEGTESSPESGAVPTSPEGSQTTNETNAEDLFGHA